MNVMTTGTFFFWCPMRMLPDIYGADRGCAYPDSYHQVVANSSYYVSFVDNADPEQDAFPEYSRS